MGSSGDAWQGDLLRAQGGGRCRRQEEVSASRGWVPRHVEPPVFPISWLVLPSPGKCSLRASCVFVYRHLSAEAACLLSRLCDHSVESGQQYEKLLYSHVATHFVHAAPTAKRHAGPRVT